MADYIPKKKLKGRNPLPSINGPILTLIKKKKSMRNYLHQASLRPSLRACALRRNASCVRLVPHSSREWSHKCNPKRFWSTLKLKSKHRGIPEVITMAIGPSSDPADGRSRTQASSPAEIVDLFNRYFV